MEPLCYRHLNFFLSRPVPADLSDPSVVSTTGCKVRIEGKAEAGGEKYSLSQGANLCKPCWMGGFRSASPLFFFESCRANSTARLNVSPRLHLRTIDVVVFDGPHSRPYLGVGFVLRCFQHLSCPDAATRLCHWRDNRYTGGLSSTVLSY